MGKDLNKYFPKNITKWPISTQRGTQHPWGGGAQDSNQPQRDTTVPTGGAYSYGYWQGCGKTRTLTQGKLLSKVTQLLWRMFWGFVS